MSLGRAGCAAALALLMIGLWAQGAQAQGSPSSGLDEVERRRVSLDARLGLGYIDGAIFDVKAMVLGVSTFYIAIGFNAETEARTRPDSFELQGLTINGTRRLRRYQIPFTFGAELTRHEWRWLHLRTDIQITGGLELEFSKLKTDDGENIPGTPGNDFLLGVGGRVQLVHPISSWLGDNLRLVRNIYLGISLDADVLSRQIQIEEVPGGTFLSISGMVVLGSTKAF